MTRKMMLYLLVAPPFSFLVAIAATTPEKVNWSLVGGISLVVGVFAGAIALVFRR